jgi:uncharacterized protein (TIGR03435 family)
MKSMVAGAVQCLLAVAVAGNSARPARAQGGGGGFGGGTGGVGGAVDAGDATKNDAANQPEPLFQITIRPSLADKHTVSGAGLFIGGGGRGGFGGGVAGGVGNVVVGAGGGGGQGAFVVGPNPGGMPLNYTEKGATASDLLTSIYHVSGPHLLIDVALPEGRFDVLIKAPNGGPQIEQLRQQAVEAALGIASHHEQHDLDAYVLTVKNKDAKGLRPTKTPNSSSLRTGLGLYSCVNADFKSLVRLLEPLLEQPVVDETELAQRYDIDLKWEQPDKDTPNAKGLIEALRDQLGLEATLAKRPIDVLVVSSQQPAGRLQFNAAAK